MPLCRVERTDNQPNNNMRHWYILVVDDDENDRILMQKSLRKANPHAFIAEAHDGQEAIDYLDGKGKYAARDRYPFPNLLLVDLKMPRRDGLAVLEHIQKNDGLNIVPKLVFSASADPDDIKKCFLCCASAYHVKPTRTDRRDELCRKLLEYWAMTEMPETDEHGYLRCTESYGKLGERIRDPATGARRSRGTQDGATAPP